MRIVIEAGHVKREIEGPYAICGSKADFEALRDALDRVLDAEKPWFFGWVDVVERPTRSGDSKPLRWEDPSA